jgi:phytoene dehydrogenase-like protein
MRSAERPVVIVGAGMAGLTCAVYLEQANQPVLLLDASDGVGGRVRTDVVDGFRLDRGFQIFLTAYPEAERLLNYTALDLRAFRSGALIRHDDNWLHLLNPLREPTTALQTLASPVGTLADKFRILSLLRRCQSLSLDELFNQPPQTTLDFLLEMGFSEQMLTRFFRPFFGGVFLEDALSTSSNFFQFCFRMFYAGDAAVPNAGMGAIPAQLASRLRPGTLRLNAPVVSVTDGRVGLASGEVIEAGAVVLAVDADQSARLLGQATPSARDFSHTTCTYFAANESPNPEKLLMLNTKRSSAVHNIAVISDVAPGYAPSDQTLISVSTQGLDWVDEATLTAQIRKELTGWFGAGAGAWRHLRTYHLSQALPAYSPDQAGTGPLRQPLRLANGLYQCGDQTSYPSLNAAMQTGRLVAEMLLA